MVRNFPGVDRHRRLLRRRSHRRLHPLVQLGESEERETRGQAQAT